MKKRVQAILLTVLLCLCMALPAFAQRLRPSLESTPEEMELLRAPIDREVTKVYPFFVAEKRVDIKFYGIVNFVDGYAEIYDWEIVSNYDNVDVDVRLHGVNQAINVIVRSGNKATYYKVHLLKNGKWRKWI